MLLALIMVISMMPTAVLTAKAEPFVPNYLTFTAQEDDSTIRFGWPSGSDVQISRDDGSTWEDYTKNTTISLNTGDTVSFRGMNVESSYYEKAQFRMTGKIAASGSVTSLTDGNGGDPGVSLTHGCYEYMFSECKALTTAPELPATNLSALCYFCMFDGCTNLTTAPALPARKAANSCYLYMFTGCTSLTEAPALPATVLESQCYSYMFRNCTSLREAPALPAETLESHCYSQMFEGCTLLTKAPELPAKTMKEGCYKGMFNGCTNLTAAPDLPATILAKECYYKMFNGCSSLKIGTNRTEHPWKIHAETVPSDAAGWNTEMFAGCTKVDFGDGSKTPALNTEYYTGLQKPVPYIYYTADGNAAVCPNDGICTEYEPVTDATYKLEDGVWYVVSGEVTIPERISVNGTANLILCDNAKLTASNGIEVSGENDLNIFAQSENENAMGKLTATGGEDAAIGSSTIEYAGIGGGNNETCGTVTIHGGNISAYGGKFSAGIGGGNGGAGGTVTIYGGKITTYGDYGSGGIGAGNNADGGMVTIYGGAVNVTGGAASGAIGGSANRNGGNITINGGAVTAKGGASGTAIGSGWQGTGGNVTINGGTVTAIGSSWNNTGVGIGGGEDSHNSTVTINGGEVTATGGDAGIGNCTLMLGEGVTFGAGDDADNITLWGSNENASKAVGQKYFVTSSAIVLYNYYTVDGNTAIKHDDGGCKEYEIVKGTTTTFDAGKWYVVSEEVTVPERISVSGTANLILCDGVTLTASKGVEVSESDTLNVYGQKGGTGALIANAEKDGSDAAIGSSYPDKGGSINIHGGSITATGSNNGAGIGGSTSNGGTINIFDGTVNVIGGKNSAGIGGGNNGTDGKITIYGGEVNATGGENSAAIGGGYLGDGGTITINGGEINATGGNNGASAIGGKNGTVTINGGAVTATASEGWSYAINNCTLTLGEGVTFGAGDDAKNITVFGDKNNASDALAKHYFVTPYEHEHSFIDGVCTICGYIDPNVYDLNGDGEVTEADLTLLLRHVAKIEVITDEDLLPRLDFDGSGAVNAADVTKLAQMLQN